MNAPDFSRLSALASGHVEARILQAGVQLKIFDHLAARPRSAAEVAGRLGADPRATLLLLNSLAALAILRKQDDRFELSAAARTYLVSDSPKSLCGMIRFDASLWSCWERLADAVRLGQPVRPANMYQEEKKETETFINAMDSLVKARGDADIVEHALEWSSITDLLDVGSGPATYPIHLCRNNPALWVTIVDLPATLEITRRYVREAGLETRFNLLSGDYRTTPIPGRYDVIFLSNIIHSESYDENERLIARLSDNLKPHGKILIKDHILDETRAAPLAGALFSLLMLLTTASGRCYAFNEVKAWLETAGLSRIRQIDLPSPLTSSLVIGER